MLGTVVVVVVVVFGVVLIVVVVVVGSGVTGTNKISHFLQDICFFYISSIFLFIIDERRPKFFN